MNVNRSTLRLVLGGSMAAVVLAAPAAPPVSAGKDPCVASEVARTVGKVVTSTGDYLDSHPDTNQVMTFALQQPPGPQTLANLKSHFEANPKVQDELAKIAEPVNEMTEQCKLAISLPQVLGLLQAVQAQGELPGPGLPTLPVAGPASGAVTQPIAVR